MVKCLFDFEFDRPDRIYNSGDTVRGTLRLQTQSNANAEAVTVIAGWKAFGKGNTSRGDYASIDLQQKGELVAGQAYEFPFEFVVPPSPWTYRGTLLNVDHVIRARVKIPWSIDPQAETAFVVQPSDLPFDTPLIPPQDSSSTLTSVLELVFALIFIIIGIPLLFLCGIGLVFIAIGLFLLFRTLRNRIAEQRLGKVTIEIKPQLLAPNEELHVSLSFAPPRQIHVDRVLITLEGLEKSTSGSGTNKTTHRHKIFQKQITALEAFNASPENPCQLDVSMHLPSSEAFSVALGDNEISWQVGVRVYLPQWPDWEIPTPLQVVPYSANLRVQKDQSENLPCVSNLDSHRLNASRDIPVESITRPGSVDSKGDLVVALESSDSSPRTNSKTTPPLPPTPPELIQLIESIATARPMGDELSRWMAAVNDRFFLVGLLVERSAYNYGVYDDESYRNGRTLIGTLVGTSLEVAIQLPELQEAQIISPTSGDYWAGNVRPIRWDELYNRMELRSV